MKIQSFLNKICDALNVDLCKNNQKRTPAQVAKERLQIIVSHETTRLHGNNFIQKLQSELLDVISKYVNIDREQIRVQLEQNGGQSVLELNVTLPEEIKAI